MALLTDFYQLTMAYGYWKSNTYQRPAVFHYFFRKKPFKGNFAITAGLESVVEFIQNFHFQQDDLDYLATLRNAANRPYFEPDFLHFLASLKFTLDVHAVEEGTLVFPHEPLVRVEGPLLQCQLLETPLLNLLNFATLIATKAARVCLAAQGDPILEFGLRRAQGIDGGLTASRSSFIGGCTATSNVLAGKLFGIPVQGTHAHSWIMAFEDEKEAFQEWSKALPDSCIFLVDTYNTEEGIKKAIDIAEQLKSEGKRFLGIRLDSGNLLELSLLARHLLDNAGFHDAKIVASNDLDEELICDLKAKGAKITVWGVGTSLVTGKDQSSLDGVYKMSMVQDSLGNWRHTMKLSEDPAKATNPGYLQIKRYVEESGRISDIIYDCMHTQQVSLQARDLDNPDTGLSWKFETIEGIDLLRPIFNQGKLMYPLPTLKQIQYRAKDQIAQFTKSQQHSKENGIRIGIDDNLYRLRRQLIAQFES